MAAAAGGQLEGRLRGGVVVSSRAVDVEPPFELIVGGHPTPTRDSERAGRRALAECESLEKGETLLVLLSGGASALMAVPADGVSLDDKRITTERLLREGADIRALNIVRKHVSAIKGGRLAERAGGASVTHAVSDVVGDDLSIIASGPTVPDPSTYDDALGVLRAHGGADAYPHAIVDYLERGARGEVADTPKPGDRRLAGAKSFVIGGRRDAMDGAAAEARRVGYQVHTIEAAVVGESRIAAHSHVQAILDHASRLPRPLCVISSGETTVRVVGRGIGGRNQEFALAAALAISGTGLGGIRGGARSPLIALASVGTDGVDGPTHAAGAIVDSTTLDRALSTGLVPVERFLDENDSHTFFAALGDLIHTGPTDTNVGDLQVVLLA